MYIPKKYGASKIDDCPFCGKQSVTKNSQGVPVCLAHKGEELKDLRCACGSWLEVKTGKFGAYFNCMKCGNINFKKALEMNPDLGRNNQNVSTFTKQEKAKPAYKTVEVKKDQTKKEITITSDELDFY